MTKAARTANSRNQTLPDDQADADGQHRVAEIDGIARQGEGAGGHQMLRHAVGQDRRVCLAERAQRGDIDGDGRRDHQPAGGEQYVGQRPANPRQGIDDPKQDACGNRRQVDQRRPGKSIGRRCHGAVSSIALSWLAAVQVTAIPETRSFIASSSSPESSFGRSPAVPSSTSMQAQ